MERARESLENGFEHINQIARSVGIKDESHFTRDFRRKFGITPTECRRKHWLHSQDSGADESPKK
ncbi:MAG: helix-turn-helix domain-containing protein [Pyrinomonadaceae bacterium]|nr:helix-turn-helix domain-containing protein [Blastocatellia bacterium]MCW5956641.1 helix-turn-helix domain-containing protein [Pyrinomonadaceae bacterium]